MAMWSWLKRTLARRAVRSYAQAHLRQAEANVRSAEDALAKVTGRPSEVTLRQRGARQGDAPGQPPPRAQPQHRSLATRASDAASAAASGARRLVAPPEGEAPCPGLKPGDRPVLLLAGVLLLMLGQWVVVAALLTLEALATVAGVLLLGIALQGTLVQAGGRAWQLLTAGGRQLLDALRATGNLPAINHNIERMTRDIADMTEMLHVLKAKTRWLPGQPPPRWEDMPFAHGAGGQTLHSPFDVKDG